MTLCTKALIQYVYEEYDIHRIEIRMSTKNKKSRAIPIRLGFTQEGILRSEERLQGNSQIVMCIVCLERILQIINHLIYKKFSLFNNFKHKINKASDIS